ncbi:MAG: thiamine pyrophosphate-dependent enzyme, partial [Streptosporangiaceae bacterium]
MFFNLSPPTAAADFAAKAVAYGMPGVRVDGIDVFAVHETAAAAVARARAGDGPSLIEAVTLRMHGHAEHDPADYVPRELKEEWAKRDPVQEAGARSSHPYQRHATAQVVGVAPHTEIG